MTVVYYKGTVRLCLVWAVSLVCFLCMNISSVGTGDSGDDWENGASAEQKSDNSPSPWSTAAVCGPWPGPAQPSS